MIVRDWRGCCSVEQAIAEHAADAHARGGSAPQRLRRISEALATLLGVEDAGKLRRLDVEVSVGLMRDLADEVIALGALGALDVAAAPDVAAVHPLGAGAGVVVKRYRYCAGESLIPVASLSAAIGAAARRRFHADMRTLGDHGFVHPDAARGAAHLWTSRETGTLVLDGWAALRKVDAPEAAEHLLRVEENLARL